MTTKTSSYRDNLRLIISKFTSQYLAFPRKTIPYILSFIGCKIVDLLLREQTITKSVNGIIFELDTRDLIDFRLFYFGNNEKHIVNYLQDEIDDKKAVLWDIGINLGSISLPVIQKCSNLIVYGFEPSPPVFARLTKNVSLNFCPRLKIYQKALGNKSSLVDFFMSPNIDNSGLGSLGGIGDRNDIKVQVECVTGDQLIEIDGLEPPSFIKIDVEGFEYKVLTGLKKFLTQSNNVKIIYEHEPYRLKSQGRSDQEIIDLLIGLGFEIYRLSHRHAFYRISSNSLEKLELSMLKEKCDLVAVRHLKDN